MQEDDFDKVVIPAGTTLYHGTDAEFDEETDALNGYAWLTDARHVAEHFARRPCEWGGKKRIVEYVTTEPIEVYGFYRRSELEDFAEAFNISLMSTTDLRETVADSNIPGWRAVGNYSPGDDVLIRDTHLLEYVRTHEV